MNLLLLSSSRANNSEYLAPCLSLIDNTLGTIRDVLFIPYAGVRVNYDDYVAMVQQALKPLNIHVKGIHEFANPADAIVNAQAVMVGGGNTFVLLAKLYEHNLIQTLQQKTAAGMPYIGWSAGSNIAGLSIRTTNDMPIIEPPSFQALGLLPLQLNPHYTDFVPVGFHGETRDMRLAEFMHVDADTAIIGLPEGTALRLSGTTLRYEGSEKAFLFRAGVKSAITPTSDLSVLLQKQV
jgi:dipeptidase E